MHGGEEGVGAAGWYYEAVAAVGNDFARAVDVGDYSGEAHGSGFDDYVGEAFAVAWEGEGIGGGEPWAHVGLMSYCLDGGAAVDGADGVGLQGVEGALFGAYEYEACVGQQGVELGECPDQLVDAFVAYEPAYEDEGEGIGAAEWRGEGEYLG